jgi:prepilin-type processing-associated H-X9-DG protein
MKEASTKESRPRSGISLLLGLVLILVGTAILLLVFGPFAYRYPRLSSARVPCMANLRQLGLAAIHHAGEFNHAYPAPEQWCDILAGQGVIAEVFRCPGAQTGPCNYAMNPNADPNDRGDVVLLFESGPGWNQYGGPELLALENHRGKGCSVSFVDGSVRFVEADELAGLKWDTENGNISERKAGGIRRVSP